MRSPRNKSITAPIVSDLPLLRCETLDSVSRCDECSPHEGDLLRLHPLPDCARQQSAFSADCSRLEKLARAVWIRVCDLQGVSSGLLFFAALF